MPECRCLSGHGQALVGCLRLPGDFARLPVVAGDDGRPRRAHAGSVRCQKCSRWSPAGLRHDSAGMLSVQFSWSESATNPLGQRILGTPHLHLRFKARRDLRLTRCACRAASCHRIHRARTCRHTRCWVRVVALPQATWFKFAKKIEHKQAKSIWPAQTHAASTHFRGRALARWLMLPCSVDPCRRSPSVAFFSRCLSSPLFLQRRLHV